MTTTATRCASSGRSFPIPEDVDLRGKRIATCPGCDRLVHVTRWNSVEQTMILTIHNDR